MYTSYAKMEIENIIFNDPIMGNAPFFLYDEQNKNGKFVRVRELHLEKRYSFEIISPKARECLDNFNLVELRSYLQSKGTPFRVSIIRTHELPENNSVLYNDGFKEGAD
ncbi:MAG: hypothetical protein AABW65_03195 [Nanoarchaeota archaeon]